MSSRALRRLVLGTAIAATAAWWSISARARQSETPFTFLAPPFTQELYSATSDILDFPLGGILGGVAFGPNGIVWTSECWFFGTRLHKFAPEVTEVHGSMLHPEEIVDISNIGPYGAEGDGDPPSPATLPHGAGGCGLVNHPDGFMYANSSYGIWKLSTTTGLPIDPTNGHTIQPGDPPPAFGGLVGGEHAQGGNALGIAVHPVSHHLVYPGKDCHPQQDDDQPPYTCSFWDLDPATGVTSLFARLSRMENAFVDGVYFDPSGNFLFAAHRDRDSATGNSLLIISSPETLKAVDALVDDAQVANTIPMNSEPDGVAFHATEGFVVTLNESNDPSPDGAPPEYAGGSMTRFDFPHGYGGKLPDGSPDVTVSGFAYGGFRGDLLQVGEDHCIYATQGQFDDDPVGYGVRYADGPGIGNSLVKICEPGGGGFAIPPGVPVQEQQVTTARLTLVKEVVNGSGGTALETDFTLTATNTTTLATISGQGGVAETVVDAGTYDLTETTLPDYNPSAWVCTGDGTQVGDSRITLAAGNVASCTITNTYQAPAPAHLTLVKVVTNDNGGTAEETDFTLSAAGPTPFSGAGGASQDVDPGTYTVSETTLPGYSAGAWSCSGGTLTGNSIELMAGQSATCTITNDDQPAQLTVIKHVVNNSGGSASANAWTMNVTAVNPSAAAFPGTEAGTTITIDAGSFGVAETGGPAGYQQTSAVGCTGTVAPGGSATCTFVNDDLPGTVSGFAYVDSIRNFTRDAGEAVLGGVLITLSNGATTTTAADGSYSFTDLSIGSYTVSGAATTPGYTLGTPSPLSVTVSPGQTTANVDFGYIPPPPPVCSGSIGDFVWQDVNRNSLQDAGEPGLAGVVVTLRDAAGAVLQTATTGASGAYGFGGLCAGSYTVDAPTPVGYDRTGTNVGSNPAIDSNASPASVTLASNTSSDLTIDFGFVNGFCEKQPVQTVLNPAGSQFPGNRGPDAVVRVHKGQSVQAAVDEASDSNQDGYIIVAVVAKDGGKLGGDTTQQVVVNRQYSAPFALIGCSVTMRDPNPGDGEPTGRVLAAASAPPDGIGSRVFLMDVHAENSNAAGWLVEGNNRYVRNTYGKNNAVGVKFVGNGNTMHNGAVESNTGAGLVVQGNNNLVTDTNAMDNGSHGVLVTGSANQVLKVDAGDVGNGNGGDGVHVEGAGNLVQEVKAFGNGGDGIEVVASTGSPNVMKKNVAGDRNKGNTGNGILVSGPGNGTASPIELEQNTTKANGLVGIRVTGTGHQLKNNVSGGTASGETNLGCEFNAAAGNVNATGNKANGTTVPGSNGSAFPTGCVGS